MHSNLEFRRSRRAVLYAAAGVAVSVAVAGCAGESVTRPGIDPSGGPLADGSSLTLVPLADRRPAPIAEGPRLGGGTISTADYPGKVVVLNVWGSWCAPCRKEAPDLEAAWQQTRRKAQFIGINTRDPTQAPALAFVRAFEITYPHLYDPDAAVLTRFSGDLPLSAIPSTLIIDRDGLVAVRIIGTITERTLIDVIDDVAAGR